MDTSNTSFVVLEDELHFSDATDATIPNIKDLWNAHAGDGAARGIASILPFITNIFGPIGYIASISEAAAGWGILNSAQVSSLKELKSTTDNLKFVTVPMDPENPDLGNRQVGHSFSGHMAALKRNNGVVDLIIKANIGFNTSYFLPELPDDNRMNDREGMCLYRDKAEFAIGPCNFDDGGKATKATIRTQAFYPITVPKITTFNWQETWNIGGELSGSLSSQPQIGAGANGSYGFSVSSTRDIPEFNQTLNIGAHGGSWRSDLQTVTDGGQPQIYNPDNLSDMIGHTIFVNWLRTPPDVAKSTDSREFLAGFTFNGPLPDHFEIPFSIAQRLNVALVIGQIGAQGARLGGVPVILPAYVETRGVITYDKKAQRPCRVENLSTTFKNTQQLVNDALHAVKSKTPTAA